MNRNKDIDVRRRLLLQLAGACALPGIAMAAEEYPARPLRLIVPFAPGGTTDLVSRLVGSELTKTLRQPVIVENKPGAGTIIGVDAAVKAPADGHTLVCVTGSFCVNQTLVKKLPYDGLRDLRSVALMGQSDHVLATHAKSGIRNVADLVAAAKRQPGSLSYASFGNGSSAHLSGEMLKEQLGIDLIHVPYKGQAPGLNDLLSGHVSLMFGNWPELRAHVQSGKLVAIGMATLKRSVYAPEVPTLAEQGVPLESSSWNGLLIRSGTPDSVVSRLNAEVNRALQAPAVLDALRANGIASRAGTPEQFAAFLQSEVAKYAQIISKAGITAEG